MHSSMHHQIVLLSLFQTSWSPIGSWFHIYFIYDSTKHQFEQKMPFSQRLWNKQPITTHFLHVPKTVSIWDKKNYPSGAKIYIEKNKKKTLQDSKRLTRKHRISMQGVELLWTKKLLPNFFIVSCWCCFNLSY